MRGRGSGGGGGGRGGRGAGVPGGGGRGRMGGPFAAGPAGFCVCPKCGDRQAHQPGVPCMEMRCPKCGTNMVREIDTKEGG